MELLLGLMALTGVITAILLIVYRSLLIEESEILDDIAQFFERGRKDG